MDILIIDDETSVSRSLKRFLESRAFSVRTATGAREAIEYIEADPPEFILCDVTMKEMDGIELLRIVRLRFPEIPFVLMSGIEDPDLIHRLKNEAFDYLKKPLKLHRLLECIEHGLRSTETAKARTG